jgi:hypothetical protein
MNLQRFLCLVKKKGTDICFDWVDDTAAFQSSLAIPVSPSLSYCTRFFLVWWLFHHISSSPLYGNLQAITLFYFKNPLFNQLELWQRSIGITVLCIILQFTHIHSLWQYQMFQHTLVHTLSWSCRHCASQPHPRHGKSCLYKATTKETRTT